MGSQVSTFSALPIPLNSNSSALENLSKWSADWCFIIQVSAFIFVILIWTCSAPEDLLLGLLFWLSFPDGGIFPGISQVRFGGRAPSGSRRRRKCPHPYLNNTLCKLSVAAFILMSLFSLSTSILLTSWHNLLTPFAGRSSWWMIPIVRR